MPELTSRKSRNGSERKTLYRKRSEQLEHELTVLKERMQSTPKHLQWDDLPEGEKFERLAPSRKRLTDTVKLVAYRAETALATIVREELSHADEARALLREPARELAPTKTPRCRCVGWRGERWTLRNPP